MDFVRFFLGTPQRFLWTLGTIAVLVAMVFIHFNPGFVEALIQRFIREVVTPIACAALTIAIIWVGFRVMTRPLRR